MNHQATGGGISVLRILLAVLAATLLYAAYQTQKANLNEYYLYLTEDRKAASFAFSELSEEWTEQRIKDRFQGYPISCRAWKEGSRACGVDVSSHNGVPAMFMTFFMESDQLREVAINVPLWARRQAEESLRQTLGRPAASQFLPRSGVRLVGWSLLDGSAVFLNRDLNVLPPFRNAIYWRSPSSCTRQGCFDK